MIDHLPECPLLEPCSADIPQHGFCSRQNTICIHCDQNTICIHCERECICDRLRACERRLIEWVRSTILERVWDLESCQKEDNCRTLAIGADLALSDVLYDFQRSMKGHDD